MGLVDGIGCWSSVHSGTPRRDPRPGLFLDRDGVVAREVGFLARPDDVELLPGAAEVIAAFNASDISVVLVTNQSGVARGYLTWSEFEEVEREIERQLEVTGARVDGVFACGYHASGRGELAIEDHPWRKPNPGMLLAAAERLGLTLGRSWMVGDRASDLVAARAAGLAGGLHVGTGHADAEERRAALALARPGFEVEGVDDISHAERLRVRMLGVATC
jgi:D-glycero-D-manno-heptose 1,7-bisphosphate phosphatase